MKLLQYVSAVAAMSHAPFLSSVAPQFFGISDYTELPAIKDLKSVFESLFIQNGELYVNQRILVV